jgi:hypothetical protein
MTPRCSARAPRGARPELGDAFVLVGLEIAQAQVFELPLDLPDAETVGERGIDALGVARDLGAALRLQVLDGPHQVHALGEHHQHHAHVLGDAEQQAAQVLLVLVLILGGDDGVDVGDLADAREIADHARDPRAEAVFELHLGEVALIQTAVEQGRDQGLEVHPQAHQDVRRGEHMAHMGLAGLDAPVAAAARQRRAGAGDLLELLGRIMARQPVEPVTDRLVVVVAMRLGEVVGRFDHGVEATLGGGGRSRMFDHEIPGFEPVTAKGARQGADLAFEESTRRPGGSDARRLRALCGEGPCRSILSR